MAARDKIEFGRDHNFFEKTTVNDAAFPDSANVLINVRYVNGFSLVNEGSAVVEYSFNGNTVHGDLTPGTPTEAIFFDNRRVSKIWFRTASAGQIVRVEAWA